MSLPFFDNTSNWLDIITLTIERLTPVILGLLAIIFGPNFLVKIKEKKLLNEIQENKKEVDNFFKTFTEINVGNMYIHHEDPRISRHNTSFSLVSNDIEFSDFIKDFIKNYNDTFKDDSNIAHGPWKQYKQPFEKEILLNKKRIDFGINILNEIRVNKYRGYNGSDFLVFKGIYEHKAVILFYERENPDFMLNPPIKNNVNFPAINPSSIWPPAQKLI